MALQIELQYDDGGLLGRLNDSIVYANERLEGLLKETSEAFITVMQTYPPQPTGVERPYNRTGRMAAGWRYDIQDLGDSGAQSHIFNRVPYSGYMHGNAERDQVQRAKELGWPTTKGTLVAIAGGAAALEQSRPDLDLGTALEEIANALADFIESGGTQR